LAQLIYHPLARTGRGGLINESGVDFFKYLFFIDGQEYFDWSSSANSIMGSGKYTVLYCPNNPQKNRIDMSSKSE